MFHHFHDDITHKKSQGSIDSHDLIKIIDYIDENYNLISPEEYLYKLLNDNLGIFDVCFSFDDGLKSQFDIAFSELNKKGINAFYFIYSSAFTDTPSLLEFNRDFRNNYYDKIDSYYDDFFCKFRNLYSSDYEKYLKEYPDNYLASYPFYKEYDKRYRYARNQILKQNYQNIVMNLMEDKNYSIKERKSLLFMNESNIKELRNSGNTIGLHSHTHPTLMADLLYSDQLSEFYKNKTFLESVLSERIVSMSHPCGNYNKDTLTILTEMGVKIGFRSSLTPSTINSNLEIPREDHSNLINFLNKS